LHYAFDIAEVKHNNKQIDILSEAWFLLSLLLKNAYKGTKLINNLKE